MMNETRFFLGLGWFLMLGSASAVVINYEADVAPDALSPNAFSFANGAPASWAVSSGELTLNTVLGNVGIWFGNGDHVPSLAVPWYVGTSEQGNYVKIRMKLTPGSETWSAYLLDQSHNAGFVFDHDGFTWSGSGGGMTLDLTEFHTFEFLLKDGVATFRLDESVVLGEVTLNPQPFSNGILVIGDGSSSDVSGSGSMIIDQVTYISSPSFSIPEPATASLMGLGLLALLRRGTRPNR